MPTWPRMCKVRGDMKLQSLIYHGVHLRRGSSSSVVSLLCLNHRVQIPEMTAQTKLHKVAVMRAERRGLNHAKYYFVEDSNRSNNPTSRVNGSACFFADNYTACVYSDRSDEWRSCFSGRNWSLCFQRTDSFLNNNIFWPCTLWTKPASAACEDDLQQQLLWMSQLLGLSNPSPGILLVMLMLSSGFELQILRFTVPATL